MDCTVLMCCSSIVAWVEWFWLPDDEYCGTIQPISIESGSDPSHFPLPAPESVDAKC